MSFVLSVLKELVSLFVDDGNLALQVLLLIAGVSALVWLAGLAPLAAGLLLLLGCLAILAVSLRRALRR